MNRMLLNAATLLTCATAATVLIAAAPAPAPAAAPAAPAGRAAGGARPPAAVRDPLAPGYVKATELPDGQVPPTDADGNFIIGRTHNPAPEMSPVPNGQPKGRTVRFTMRSQDSKLYPGVLANPDTATAFDKAGVHANPAAWSRTVTVYIPPGYVEGTPAPVLFTSDGDNRAVNVLDHLIPQKKLPAMIVVAIQAGGGDGAGSERGLEYDTMSSRYSDFVETEVVPLVEKNAKVVLTKDPDGRAVAGTSSGAAAGMIMAWFHPERYHRVLTFSGTFVNTQSPRDPAFPNGAWGLHDTEIPKNPVKPLRIFIECGDHDNGSGGGTRDWVAANEDMAKVLAEKGYHYKFVFARNAGHTDRPTISQLYPTALQWVWQGYTPEGEKKAADTQKAPN